MDLSFGPPFGLVILYPSRGFLFSRFVCAESESTFPPLPPFCVSFFFFRCGHQPNSPVSPDCFWGTLDLLPLPWIFSLDLPSYSEFAPSNPSSPPRGPPLVFFGSFHRDITCCFPSTVPPFPFFFFSCRASPRVMVTPPSIGMCLPSLLDGIEATPSSDDPCSPLFFLWPVLSPCLYVPRTIIASPFNVSRLDPPPCSVASFWFQPLRCKACLSSSSYNPVEDFCVPFVWVHCLLALPFFFRLMNWDNLVPLSILSIFDVSPPSLIVACRPFLTIKTPVLVPAVKTTPLFDLFFRL